jgi:predicted nucleic acid-binding protein
MEPLTAFLDANVLYRAALRNLLMRLAMLGAFRAKWSDGVHEEWIRSVLANRPDLTRAQLERTRQLMDAHVPESLVSGYEPLIETLTLPDPDDRHVLAAAITGQANIIVTFNLHDFPAASLRPHAIKAWHPDRFITHLLDREPDTVCAAARQHRASLKHPPKTVAEYLATLERHGLPLTVARLQEYAALL